MKSQTCWRSSNIVQHLLTKHSITPVNQPGSFKTLDDWLPWLETLSPREIVLGLERVQLVLERLDLKRPELVINVAGTNGKGSSVAMFGSLLGQGGMTAGCYTSPHVSRYNERTRICGQPASDDLLIQSLQRVEDVRGDVPLTFFEFGTLATLVAFDSAKVDAWVLEVGLGGRLDAVNAIEPDACLITNVSLDHCAWLGNDVESIAGEKAGIMRSNKPVVYGSADVPQAISKTASDLGAELLLAGKNFSFAGRAGGQAHWSWNGSRLSLPQLRPPAMPGQIQMQNVSAVLAVMEALHLDHFLAPDVVNASLTETVLDGRFQIVENSCRWLLDVAHNPAAAKVLSDLLREQDFGGKVTAVIGMLADKDVEGVIEPLNEFVESWIAVTVEGARAETATQLAIRIANASNKPCLIAESAYLVGPALEWLRGRPGESA
jgi:dihydrofolate synthase/folylpolyglutamate synthase